ncbi:MAG: S8 family peptidase [Vicingaceae bacterium]|nr:S8 family peptidase [Vicingaceae bacterium]
MKNIFLFLLVLCTSGMYGQYSKINITLKIELEKHNSKELFPLFVIGNTAKIKAEVQKLGGEFVRSVDNIAQIKLPVGVIESFSQNSFVQAIPYSFSKGKALSDTMTVHNNVTPIHNGISPLLQPYTGKGVVVGVIDTGNDIVHPDFKDTLGNTRIYRIWDQVTNQYWDSTSINNNTCTHTDYDGVDHGTHVAGIAAGNGLAVNNYCGVAPEATIVAVASDFNAPNWLLTVVDAAAYIFDVADSLNMPCVINASIGEYFGSHDGTDPAAKLIDSLVNYKPGRAFVAAAGNAGFFNWHVNQLVDADTSSSYLKYNASSSLGFGSVFYEVWSDTIDFNNVDYAFGANLPNGTFEERGRTSFFNIKNRLGTFTDTIKNGSNILAIVQTYAELQGDKYLLQVLLNEPDSNTYNFSILSTGSGKFDFWSTSLLGTSDIVSSGLPTVTQYPPIAHYTKPDSSQTMVSSFQCHPNLLTVANFVNRKTYLDVDSIVRLVPVTPGEKANSSSIGPNRRGVIKPDIGATGDYTIGPNSAAVIAANMSAGPIARERVAFGGMHRRNGGTSMASPVVAGVVALYFEKCPNATMAEVKNALLSTAKQDTFTGAVPNFAFGYGKVNAFAALTTSNFKLGNDINICDGDSVQISSPPFNSYLWSTGDTTASIYADTTQMVYLSGTYLSGCISKSDTLNISWRPLPTKPIINVNGNSLSYFTNHNLQWYYNFSILAGETDTLHIAQSSGDYFVVVTDSFGCKNVSDTLNHVLLGIENIPNTIANIYPNPTNGSLSIEFKSEKITDVEVLNVLGKKVFSENINSSTKKVSLSLTHLAEGVYYVRLISPEKDFVSKVILLK